MSAHIFLTQLPSLAEVGLCGALRRSACCLCLFCLAVCLLLAHKRRQAQRIRDRQNQDVRRATPGECVHARDPKSPPSSPSSPLLLSCLGASPNRYTRARGGF